MSKKKFPGGTEIVASQGPWRELLLVCRKCSKKLKGGFGEEGEDSLPKALKPLLRERGLRRSVRVLEVGCLGLCPKGGVTVVASSRPGEMLVVPEGADLHQLAARLHRETPEPAADVPEEPQA